MHLTGWISLAATVAVLLTVDLLSHRGEHGQSTRETYVVYASNAFATLGLRSLYIVLSRVLGELRHLHLGIAGVLVFTGFKMIAHRWAEISSAASIVVIVVIIGAAVVASLAGRGDGD